MSFLVNTNMGALRSYNALAKVNAQTAQAQLRLATQQRINQVADDTSGFNVGKRLEAQTATQKAQIKNISSARNYLSTSESALMQINDKLIEISSKQIDAKDPLKNQKSIADDIRTLALEIDSILKNTNINGAQLLASADGSTPLANANFDISGAAFNVDFGAVGNLNPAALATAIGSGGLTSTTDSTVVSHSVTAVTDSVRSALGRIGNLTQTLDSREEFLTAAIANNTASMSSIFDADIAMEQLNATKGQLAGQIASAMLSQTNSAPQNVLALFR